MVCVGGGVMNYGGSEFGGNEAVLMFSKNLLYIFCLV